MILAAIALCGWFASQVFSEVNMKLRALLVMVLILFVGFFTSNKRFHAQETIAISIAVPRYLTSVFPQQLINTFQAEHPNLNIKVTPIDIIYPSASNDLRGYFDSIHNLASSADVVFVDGETFNPLATRTGAFLNLSPLVSTDRSISEAAYFSKIWQSFNWDGQMWAIPVVADVAGFTYNPKAFDALNLSYPNPRWGINELVDAVQKLTASGQRPGLDVTNSYYQAALFRSLITNDLVDTSSPLDIPIINQPDSVKLLEKWNDLQKNDAISKGTDAPLSIERLQKIDGRERQFNLLPGNRLALRPYGFALSKGTAYPEQAYVLIRYLSEIGISWSNSQIPLVRTQLGTVSSDQEITSLIKEGIESALSTNDIRYVDYLSVALSKMSNSTLDARSALDETQLELRRNLDQASNFAAQSVSVATSVPVAKVQSINFFAFFLQPSYGYDADLWRKMADEFVANDLTIKQVNFQSGYNSAGNLGDCNLNIYKASSIGKTGQPGEWTSTQYIDLKPYFDVDPDFHSDDFIGDTLSRLQFGNKVFGYPLAIIPAFLKYNQLQFQKAGIPEPTNDWTVSEFVDALKRLKDFTATTPFQQSYTRTVGSQSGSLHLLMLMNAFGASPIEYTSEPWSIKTDQSALDAAQQVLDLVKNGYIKYYKDGLGYLDPKELTALIKNADTAPITTEVLSPYTTRHIVELFSPSSPFRPILYPRGSQTSPVAYDVIAATIDPNAVSPDGCYRWIKFIKGHPELIQAMPASRRALDNSTMMLVHGSSLVAFYKQVAQRIASPYTTIFPVGVNLQSDLYTYYWIGQSFNKYLLENKDLKAELEGAASFQQSYLQLCDAKITLPAEVPSSYTALDAVMNTYFNALKRCAWQIDPTLRGFG